MARQEELESLVAIYGDDHVFTGDNGSVTVVIDVDVPEAVVKGSAGVSTCHRVSSVTGCGAVGSAAIAAASYGQGGTAR